MGDQEFGKCDICGNEAVLSRTYFYYPIHCQCCGSKDKNGQMQHFVMVRHCDKCVPKVPTEIHPLLRDMCGNEIRADIKNIMPEDISGQFIIDDKIITHK